MATEQDLQLEYEYAQAKAKAEAEQNQKMEMEINARGPTNTSGSPDDRQVINDQKRQEEYDNNYASGIENIPHNTILEAKGLAKGAANAVTGTLQTANAVGHSIGSALGRAYDAAAPSVGLSPRDPARVKAASEQADREQKALQDVQFKETTGPDKFFMPAGQIATNIALAGGVGGAVKGAATKALGTGAIAKTGGYLAGGLAGGATAAASFPSQEGLLVRSDGLVGFDIKPDDDASTAQTKKFINQSLDNMALGAFGDVAYRSAGKVKEVVGNLYRSFADHNNLPAMQQKAAEDILSVYGQLGEHPTAAQQEKAAQEVIDLIDKNGIENYDFGGQSSGLPGNNVKQVKKDTISTITSGLNENDPLDRAVKTKMEALRASAKRGNAPQTQVQLEEPERVLQEGLGDIQAIRGGNAATEQTTRALQSRATQEATAEDAKVIAAKENLAKQSADYTDVLKKDTTFGPTISEAENRGVKLNIHELEQSKKTQIVEAVKDIRSADAAVRNAAYDKVSETGVAYGPKLWSDAVQKAGDAIPANIQKLIDESDGTFGYLNNEIRPRLSDQINELSKAKLPDYDTINKLKELRDNITEKQIDYIKKKAGGSAAARAADEATAENIRYSNKYNQGIGRELKVNEKVNNPRKMEIDFKEKGRDIVDSAINNPNRTESIGQLKGILGPEKEGLVADTALAKATQDITAGKGANIDKITSDLQKMSHNFGPEQRKRLEDTLTNFKNKKITLDQLEAEIPNIQKASDQAKEAIFNEKFPTLFEKVSGKQIPKGRGYEVFKDAMNSQQPRVIERLVEEANKSGDIGGIQSAWARLAEEKLTQNSKSVGKLEDNFIENGEKIFGKDAPEVTAVKQLRDYASKLEESLNKPGLQGLDHQENQKSLRSAISFVQTFVFGVLNPTAARVNKITSQLAEKYNSRDLSHIAIDNVLSDNQKMKQAMQILIDKNRNKLSPATWKQLTTAAARFGLYKARQATGADYNLNIQTDKALEK